MWRINPVRRAIKMAMSTSPVGWDKEDLRAQVELWKAKARTPIITYCINYIISG
jgi:hypothetical protein